VTLSPRRPPVVAVHAHSPAGTRSRPGGSHEALAALGTSPGATLSLIRPAATREYPAITPRTVRDLLTAEPWDARPDPEVDRQ
jgi:hypothetical protein